MNKWLVEMENEGNCIMKYKNKYVILKCILFKRK